MRQKVVQLGGAIADEIVDQHFDYDDEGYQLVLDVDEVVGAVEEAAAARPGLRATRARRAAEIVPDLDWDKGYAVRWLLEEISPREGRLTPVYAGDDLTDEDALRVVGEKGGGGPGPVRIAL